MRQILLLLVRYRNFFLFVVLEAIALGLIQSNNIYHHAVLFTFSNRIAGYFNYLRLSLVQYLQLGQQNRILSEQNALLLQQLLQRPKADTVLYTSPYLQGYYLIPARVIHNSIAFQNNYLLLDKGTKDGVKPGMGIVTPNGVVGKVKSCTEHVSLAYSFLHNDLSVSVKVKRLNILGTLKWRPGNPTQADLLYISQHEKVALGDTIVTAGFNAVYPPNLPIGIISNIRRESITLANNAFLDLQVRLHINYAALDHVYIVGHSLTDQINQLTNQVSPEVAKD
ncbi:MAG: rod shape-determining protein MreC [Cytophagales bacterium]|nr:rod shape-determining protein MreC [Bernardetiaceae bacterium]MDW8211403.1 rod shape-determining protein MreC [Cytophagales bacterium]